MHAPLSIRAAEIEDVHVIFRFIKALAEYERLEQEVTVTEELLKENLFGARRTAEVILASEGEVQVGFAVFFHNFSTFLGKPGIYLEDLFILPEFRGRGYGKAMMRHLAKVAVERGCGRFEWWVLDWNEPALDFYRRLGAIPMSEWTVQRISGEALFKLADTNS